MSGYTYCPCRDCFEIAIDGSLCNLCEEAGCSADCDSECEAWGNDDIDGPGEEGIEP